MRERRESTDVNAEADSIGLGTQLGSAPFVNPSAFISTDPTFARGKSYGLSDCQSTDASDHA